MARLDQVHVPVGAFVLPAFTIDEHELDARVEPPGVDGVEGGGEQPTRAFPAAGRKPA